MKTKPLNAAPQTSDVCLILEGTYPFVPGGVSSWVHDIITSQPQLTFEIVALLAPGASEAYHYTLPSNVKHVHITHLQELPKLESPLTKKQKKAFFNELEMPLLQLQIAPSHKHLEQIMELLKRYPHAAGHHLLLNSRESWNMLLRMYNATMGDICFLDYFWSWRVLIGGLFSVLLTPLPKAHVYHSVCTGYAGVMLARAKLETGNACLLTEHGIYTNERCIEIATAAWLDDGKAMNFNVDKALHDKSLREFWMEAFTGYSNMCYKACDLITTLFKGNHKLQIADGAPEDRLQVVSNGIDVERFSDIKRTRHKQPTIALIGRVVPIKDIKTYIRVCALVRETIPDLQAYVFGPYNEDPEYYQECVEMIHYMGLEEHLILTGQVDLKEYLGKIDVMLLTSISEAQPLVILEAGAAGIPSVVTDVGGCREMIEGRDDESPPLGPGGIVTPLAEPREMAKAVVKMLQDKPFYKLCSTAIKKRVQLHYHKKDMHKSYHDIYNTLITQSQTQKES